ncbi:MAG: hypothetical protein ACFFG0_43700 [Candidatus Thorarchaeota archaeon]
MEDTAGIDPTIFRYNGKWWVLYTDADLDNKNNLCDCHAPDFFGPWKKHVLNPLKIDIRSSRPAGTPFIHNGNLYRPAQDCSRIYGGRIIINRINRLSETEFDEEAISVVEPQKKIPFPRRNPYNIDAWGYYNYRWEKIYLSWKGNSKNNLAKVMADNQDT